MSDDVRICDDCGGEIIFRYMGGRPIPIHLDGGCGGGSGGSYVEEPEVLQERGAPRSFYDDFCRPTTCPICGAEVFFIRHNGGSVWVDELGWPWPKHACFDEPSARRVLDHVREPSSRSSVNLALVLRARVLDSGETELLVRLPNNTMRLICVRGSAIQLAGELVSVREHSRQVVTSVPGLEILTIVRSRTP